MSENDQKISPPEWMTVAFIETVLKEGLNKPDLKIQKCDIGPATAKGDNYGSVMFRIRLALQVNEKSDDFSIVVKIPPESKYAGDIIESQIFKREIKMFTKTIPALNDILRKVYPEQENLAAECYFAKESSSLTCIFLEDLRKSGFTLADRFAGLDEDHTTLVLRSLAKLHASSLVHMDQDSDAVSLYDQPVWTPELRHMAEGFLQKPLKYIVKNINKWEDVPKKDLYYQKMKDLEETVVDKYMDAFKRDENKLNVICHGDAWINNMMFRYDENHKVKALRFLDFQITHYNSPAMDLNYFIFLCIPSRFTNVDSLLRIYYDMFIKTLNDLKYEMKMVYTFDDLKKDFHDKLLYGLVICLTILPIVTVPTSKVVKLDDMMDKDGTESGKVYDRQEFMDVLKVALPFFEKAGVF